MKPPQGLVSGIERFALHDGPGIRTLVFMKGCPMRCLWCSSPQTQNPVPEILYNIDNCRRCGACIGACPAEARMLSNGDGITIDRSVCTGCGKCVEICPDEALELSGSYVTVNDLVSEVAKDSPFYRRSSGGVTVGGGEPTIQHEFVEALLEKINLLYIHTAIETCGYVKWAILEKLLRYTDLVYMDIKHMDAVEHKNLTGVSNELILENARRISESNPLVVRIPVAPGYNDSKENVLATARFASGLGKNFQGVELLPYHRLGAQTYAELGRKFELEHVEPPGNDHMDRLKELIESCGVSA